MFEQPWPNEDKLAIIATAVDEGFVGDGTPDLELYGRLWERIERVKQTSDVGRGLAHAIYRRDASC